MSLKIIDEHFMYEVNDEEYQIFSSVLGVFSRVVYAMQNSEMAKKF